jgi:sulfate permease, SulP family
MSKAPAASKRSSWPSWKDYAGVKGFWRGDVLAGLTVGVVALPLALGFGVASGVGARAGVVTAIVAGIVAAVFGGSRVQVSGPTGAMAVVLVPIVAHDGASAVSSVAIMAGVIVIVMGRIGLGRAIQFVPWPVLEGFTLGIATTIALQQVPLLAGLSRGQGSSVLDTTWNALHTLSLHTALPAVSLGLIVVLVMLTWPLISTRVPGSIVAVIVATLASIVAGFHVPTLSGLPHSFPSPRVPNLSWSALQHLAGPALAVAVLAALESLLSARVADAMSGGEASNDRREMYGQGLANIAAGVFGGMPATGAIARTAVNVKSGAKSRLSAIIHSLVILVIIAAATPLVERIPLSVLGGVLAVTAVRMVDRANVRRIIRVHPSETLVWALTAIMTVVVNLITAIEVGLVLASLFALRAMIQGSGAVQERLAEHHDGPVDEMRLLTENIAIVRFDGALFFGATPRFSDVVAKVGDVRVVILRCKGLSVLDASGAELLVRMIEEFHTREVSVLVKGMSSPHRRIFTSLSDDGVIDNHFFDDLPAAIAHARTHVHRSLASPDAPTH